MIILNETNSKNNIIFLSGTNIRDKSIIYLILFSFFLSQFYFWSSGVPQFSHIFIMGAILLLFSKSSKINIEYSNIILLFVAYAICVNFAWYLIVLDSSYMMSTVYWIFNLLFFLLMMNLNQVQIKFFYEKLLFLIPFSYIVEIIIWVSNLGRYDFEPRYNGLFNDPNQMAFWVLSSCAIYLYISGNGFKKITVYFLALFLILLTMSRSASIGFLMLTLGLIFSQKGDLNKRIFVFIGTLVLFGSLSYFLYNLGVFDSVVLRFMEGLDQRDSQVEGRGLFSFLDYPQYLIFGAGQGAHWLYNPTGNEIHSTWLGILFYYGIIGISLFLIFLYQIFKKLSLSNKMIFLGPMLYGFTTYSARTLIFWFLLAAFLIFSNNNKEE
ncbi:O-antigen ligase family protein [Acinetobacter lwoffii]|uniref:O-antigen ligase family protein n=1 Tax=Acinetobacter lwoffii TaxID=28090 RepID=UPI00209773B0|nr:O-antigen ligase family protein [Acinetobacter lwoffii]MCO8083006.1 O-antigen ligase family protein [Acinetobacter lwoffii]